MRKSGRDMTNTYVVEVELGFWDRFYDEWRYCVENLFNFCLNLRKLWQIEFVFCRGSCENVTWVNFNSKKRLYLLFVYYPLIIKCKLWFKTSWIFLNRKKSHRRIFSCSTSRFGTTKEETSSNCCQKCNHTTKKF